MRRSWIALFLVVAGCGGELASPADGGARDARAEDARAADAASIDAASIDAASIDAASIDAASALDAPSVDAGSDAGPAPGDCTGRLLCEDFESYTTGMRPGGPWSSSTSRATIAVDETRAVSGSRAVRFTTEGGDGSYRRAYITVDGAPVFPVAGNIVYGRMMIYVDELPGADRTVHWTNISGEGLTDAHGTPFHSFYRYGGMNDDRYLANYETGDGVQSDCWRSSATAMRSGEWLCMEWRFSGPEDQMTLWIDGTEISDAGIDQTGDGCVHDYDEHWHAPVFDTMRVGWEHYQASIAHDVWIDDVALDDERIGCPSR